eukprot:scaffold44894_cov61-Phaeocystis_antarctica.AAC.2
MTSLLRVAPGAPPPTLSLSRIFGDLPVTEKSPVLKPCLLSASSIRPSTPLEDASCPCTFCATLVCTLCAPSCGGN